MTDSKSSAFDPLDLCARILRREPAAEAELVDRFLPRVRTMVAIRTGKQDTMEDLSHEVMLEALCALRREMPRNPEMLAAFILGSRGIWSTDTFAVRRDAGLRISQLRNRFPTAM